jgi:hypothetical protein
VHKIKYGFFICQIIDHVLKTQKSISLFSAYQKAYQDPDMDFSQEKHGLSGINIALYLECAEKTQICDVCSQYLSTGREKIGCHTVEVRSLHITQPNTFKLSFSQFLTFNPSKNSLS